MAAFTYIVWDVMKSGLFFGYNFSVLSYSSFLRISKYIVIRSHTFLKILAIWNLHTCDMFYSEMYIPMSYVIRLFVIQALHG